MTWEVVDLMRNSALVLTAWSGLACLAAFSGFAAAPAIGTTTTNSEIVEGSQWQTASAGSELNLQSGVNVRLSPRSESTVFRDHLVLSEGSVRVGHFSGYTVAARRLQIQSEDSATQAVVRVTGKTVEVASLGGNLNVTDGGAMLTRVAAGTRMSFQQSVNGQPAPAPVRKRLPSDQRTMVWLIAITGAAALAIGLTAAAQGKSPF